ncbi:RIP metalloprotease RseP [Brachymonas denitrificans]|uniref:RIP metalloprotease RseP n=1 Tax=Brachymonas denitrificans TaxID=28220 RepID=UPI001BCD1294|nr:RIP metalloprotease RseP [Brachymonas denitrificans]
MITLLAFLVALGLLITIHEYGHYRVARACDVKVLKFSVGFGKPLWSWTSPRSGTEYAVAALPLGGFVRMLDEREAPVPADQRHLAFNTQSVWKRIAIVAAGPLANLLLAVLIYSGLAWYGMSEVSPVIAQPAVGSLADKAGLRSGDRIVSLRWLDDEAQEVQPVRSLGTLQWELTQAALQGRDVELQASQGSDSIRTHVLAMQQAGLSDVDAGTLERIGIAAPFMPPLVGEMVPGEPAERAGLQVGDRVLRVDGKPVEDAAELRRLVRAETGGKRQLWQVSRNGELLEIAVAPQAVQQEGVSVGRIGAFLGAPPEMTTVRLGAVDGAKHGLQRTWDMAAFSLRMLGRMVVGEASLRNLSGPISIADYAGRSARAGLATYIAFLALISVSLGVLNLLPIPILDGGHLMYYLWEAATGRAVPDAFVQRLQQIGMAILIGLMGIALFNDLTRVLGT